MESMIKRGDIYYYNFGEAKGNAQCGRRPVLCLQADDFNLKSPTIIVAAITTVTKKQYLPSHIMLPMNTGLKQPSMLLLEQIRAINKIDLGDYVGFLDDEQTWRYINKALKKIFGLWIFNAERIGDIRCLCSRCLQDYKNNSSFIVKRLDPFCNKKDRCTKCDSLGYDYVVYDRRSVKGAR